MYKRGLTLSTHVWMVLALSRVILTLLKRSVSLRHVLDDSNPFKAFWLVQGRSRTLVHLLDPSRQFQLAVLCARHCSHSAPSIVLRMLVLKLAPALLPGAQPCSCACTGAWPCLLDASSCTPAHCFVHTCALGHRFAPISVRLGCQFVRGITLSYKL